MLLQDYGTGVLEARLRGTLLGYIGIFTLYGCMITSSVQLVRLLPYTGHGRALAAVDGPDNKVPHILCPWVRSVMLELNGSVQRGSSAPQCGKAANILEAHVSVRSKRLPASA